jgi:hypothetical protein
MILVGPRKSDFASLLHDSMQGLVNYDVILAVALAPPHHHHHLITAS